mgnify:CR=1 FL=1
MLKIFVIEWWDSYQNRFQQEYFTRMESAAARFAMLRDDVPDSNPCIETLNVSEE